MDGVVLQSQRHWNALVETSHAELLPDTWKPGGHKHFIGLNAEATHRKAVEMFGLHLGLNEYRRFLGTLAEQVYGQLAEPTPGVPELLERLRAADIPLAIASSTDRVWIEIGLRRVRLLHYFEAITGGDEVEGRGKPDPLIYQLSAKKLDVLPIFSGSMEDADHGVTSAKAAEMKCIGLKERDSTQDLSHADIVVASPHEVTMELLHSLFDLTA